MFHSNFFFQSINKPTLNTVVLKLATFELHLNKINTDYAYESPESTLVRTIKLAFDRKFSKTMNIPLYKAAALLDPSVESKIESICQRIPRWGDMQSVFITNIQLCKVLYGI
jgi:hypothetical protein